MTRAKLTRAKLLFTRGRKFLQSFHCMISELLNVADAAIVAIISFGQRYEEEDGSLGVSVADAATRCCESR